MKIRTTVAAAGIALLCQAPSHAVTLSTAKAHAYECINCDALSHDTLSTRWRIHTKQLGHQTQHQQVSKKYFVNTTFNAIEKGLDLYTQAPGAVIRISAIPSTNSLSGSPEFKPTFYIKTKKSELLPLNEASSLFAADENLNQSYFSQNTSAILQLKPALGAGKITLLASPTPGHENDQFIVHVFDKDAPSYLTIGTNKAIYQYGEQLTTTIALGDDLSHYPLDSIKDNLVTSEGKKIPLLLKKNYDHSYTATTTLKSEKNNPGDNWYVEAETSATVEGNIINRQAHSAFTYAIPSAVIKEINQTKSAPFTFNASLEVATGSRYVLQAVLYKTNEKGNKIPLELAQSASWLTPGTHEIHFSFSPEDKNTANIKYYVSAIQLIDYGQIKPIFGYNGFIPVNTDF